MHRHVLLMYVRTVPSLRRLVSGKGIGDGVRRQAVETGRDES